MILMYMMSLFVLIFIFALEIITRKNKQILLNPVLIIIFSLAFVYYGPIGISEFFGFYSPFSSLPHDQKFNLITYLFIFSLSFFFFWVLKKIYLYKKNIYLVRTASISSSDLVFVLMLAFLFKYIYLASGLGFSPELVFDRYINPRDYTYIVSGTGPINYLHNAFLHLSLFYFFSYLLSSNNKIEAAIFLALVGLLVVGGGGKQNFLWFFFYFMYFYQIYNNKFFSLKRILFIFSLLFVSSISVLLVAFMLVRRQGESDGFGFLKFWLAYQEEAYFSAKILEFFNYHPFETYRGLRDTVLAIIPRQIWPEKPFLGYFNAVWRDHILPGSPIYHTSTTGFVSESWMMLGYAGPLVYAFLFLLLSTYIERCLYCSYSINKKFQAILLSILIYFFVRDGFLGYTLLYPLVLIAIATFYFQVSLIKLRIYHNVTKN